MLYIFRTQDGVVDVLEGGTDATIGWLQREFERIHLDNRPITFLDWLVTHHGFRRIPDWLVRTI